jgi:hypothetical protein
MYLSGAHKTGLTEAKMGNVMKNGARTCAGGRNKSDRCLTEYGNIGKAIVVVFNRLS